MAIDRETAWKELLDHAPYLALAFFYPDIHGDLDESHDPESLEPEFRKLLPESVLGKKIVDKLLKVVSKSGDDRYLHFEIQAYFDSNFERRVYIYNSRAEDRFGQPVVSLVLLIDEDENWVPKEYCSELYGTRRVLTFRPIKVVVEWRDKDEELLAHPNPVALFVLAFLKGKEFADDEQQRGTWLIRLIQRLRALRMSEAEMGRWVSLFGWLLPLSPGYNARLAEAMSPEEKERLMPLMNYWEKVGYEKGEESGIEKGIEKGKIAGLIQAIELGLELKFGADAIALSPLVARIDSLASLQSIFDAIKPASSLDDIRRLLPPTSNGQG